MSRAPDLPRALIAAALAAFVAAAGCSQGNRPSSSVEPGVAGLASPASPSRPQPEAFDAYVQPFYPLAVGNHWLYANHTRVQLVTREGPRPPVFLDGQILDRISGIQSSGNRDYFVQLEFASGIRAVVPTRQFLVRQDASGYFELPRFIPLMESDEAPATDGLTEPLLASIRGTDTDASERAAFARAARDVAQKIRTARLAAGFGWSGGGPDPFELSHLRYPLRAGMTWVQRTNPLFVRTITGLDRLTTPAGSFFAWRVRITSPAFGHDVSAAVWYAHAGLVRLAVHAESNAIDNADRFVGRVITDSDQLLVETGGPIPVGLASGTER